MVLFYCNIDVRININSDISHSTLERSIQIFVSKGFSQDEAGWLYRRISNGVAAQSFLLSNMEIFTLIGYGMLTVVVLLVINRHLKQTFDVFRNKLWGT